MSTPEPSSDSVDELGADVDQVVRKASRTVDLGHRGLVVSLAVFVLIVGLLLPWVGEHVGWQVLGGQAGPIPQLFAVTSTGFGVLGSMLALITRRWWIAWGCAIGGWFASVDGMLAIWSQQSSQASGAVGGGPGFGLILAVIATVVIAFQWMRAAWSRS
ncbi:hypothetical protein [Amycolatopsis sp. YIM 10]|uniref:Rv2732c family membrane protein n=1 Tax=Amycolatopsis sp. YIM 10 TaxID=2653857 RepID=UPI001290822F|nr:hypothetical protein [Amycolatopsis sp. YIM 10]QFU87823.1 hypothetical protein YIM_13185 [Amycolatopsis sp. YIM 10]